MTAEYKPYLLILWTIILIFASALPMDFLFLFACSIFGTPVILLLSFFWPRKWDFLPSDPKILFVMPVCVAIILSVLITYWPFKLHFLMVRPKLNRIAARIESGEHPPLPFSIGIFRITKIEMNHEPLFLRTNLRGNRRGFSHSDRDYSDFNLGHMIILDDDWKFVFED